MMNARVIARLMASRRLEFVAAQAEHERQQRLNVEEGVAPQPQPTENGNAIMDEETAPLLDSGRREPSRFPRNCLIASILLGVVFVGAVIGSYLLSVEDLDGIDSETFVLIKRFQWGAATSKPVFEPFSIPLEHVLLSYTNTGNCSGIDECKIYMLGLQQYYMTEQNMTDLPYNFLVSSDGVVYEGRGLEILGSLPESQSTLCIAFIGAFNSTVLPSKKQLEKTEFLIEKYITEYLLKKCYNLVSEKYRPLTKEIKEFFTSKIPKDCYTSTHYQ